VLIPARHDRINGFAWDLACKGLLLAGCIVFARLCAMKPRPDAHAKPAAPTPASRQERLAKALKANLTRRKKPSSRKAG